MLALIALEARLLVRERMAIILLALAIAACALAFVNGRVLLDLQIAGRAASATEDAKTDSAFREKLTKPARPEDAILYPLRVKLPLAAPLPALVDFTAGRAAFENYSTTITLRSRIDTLFRRTQLDNPEMTMRGAFDLGFVVIVVAPLLLIGLGYGLFAADRDSGAARLVLAQAGTPLRLLVARSVPRLALVLTPILLTALALLATGPEIAGRDAAALAWLAISATLLLLWWAVVFLINSLRVTAETAALALVGTWGLVTLVLPPLIAAISHIAYPPPSRFDEIATARAAEVASTTAYENDHADLASEDLAGRLASARKTYAIGRAVGAATSPVSEAFDAQLARQQGVARTLTWTSPSLVAAEALAAVAGTDGPTWLGFRQATAAYLTDVKGQLGGFIERGTIMTWADYAALPRFAWQPRPERGGTALVVLLLLALGIGGIAVARFRRVRLD